MSRKNTLDVKVRLKASLSKGLIHFLSLLLLSLGIISPLMYLGSLSERQPVTEVHGGLETKNQLRP
jgi:hypothetical protein